jgi:hypothetical protein
MLPHWWVIQYVLVRNVYRFNEEAGLKYVHTVDMKDVNNKKAINTLKLYILCK